MLVRTPEIGDLNYLFPPAKGMPCRASLLLVGRGRFELPKSVTSDLQSDPFGRSGIFPCIQLPRGGFDRWSRRLESNPQPADYKSAALPVELHRHGGASGRNRTTDTGIFSPLLYRLSYRGILKPAWQPTYAIKQAFSLKSGDPERSRTVDLQRDRLAF